MKPSIRKTVTFIETTYIEGGRAPDVPVEMAGVAAVIQNPWVGRGFVENLRPEILTMAPVLGDLLVRVVQQVYCLHRDVLAVHSRISPFFAPCGLPQRPLRLVVSAGTPSTSHGSFKAAGDQ